MTLHASIRSKQRLGVEMTEAEQRDVIRRIFSRDRVWRIRNNDDGTQTWKVAWRLWKIAVVFDPNTRAIITMWKLGRVYN